MHEVSLCKNILEIILEKVGHYPNARIKTITLELGILAKVDEAALIFSFSVVAKGTAAENAALYIVNIPTIAYCEYCSQSIEGYQYSEPCVFCGHYDLRIMQGEELRIKSLEIE